MLRTCNFILQPTKYSQQAMYVCVRINAVLCIWERWSVRGIYGSWLHWMNECDVNCNRLRIMCMCALFRCIFSEFRKSDAPLLLAGNNVRFLIYIFVTYIPPVLVTTVNISKMTKQNILGKCFQRELQMFPKSIHICRTRQPSIRIHLLSFVPAKCSTGRMCVNFDVDRR